ncbi:MAG TPA: YecA family protein [Gammaproteobacteria bacterium]
MKQANEVIDALNTALGQVQTEMRAVECHGTLTGLFCAKGELKPAEWVEFIGKGLDSNNLLQREALAAFKMLFEVTREQLNDSVLDFHPLLPEDGADVEDRIEALGQWCQGFLLGLSAGGISDLDKLPGDSGEILRDMVEIARAGSYELDGDEEDEQSFNELLEYVRTGVLLLNEELHPTKAPPRDGVTLH